MPGAHGTERAVAYAKSRRKLIRFPGGAFTASTAFNEETMTSEAAFQTLHRLQGVTIQDQVNFAIDDLLGSFPDPGQLSVNQRRGIIARYTAVLEGNFIYWMTATYLS